MNTENISKLPDRPVGRAVHPLTPAFLESEEAVLVDFLLGFSLDLAVDGGSLGVELGVLSLLATGGGLCLPVSGVVDGGGRLLESGVLGTALSFFASSALRTARDTSSSLVLAPLSCFTSVCGTCGSCCCCSWALRRAWGEVITS